MLAESEAAYSVSMRERIFACAVLCCAGCGDDASGRDAGSERDASSGTDASASDAGRRDAGFTGAPAWMDGVAPFTWIELEGTMPSLAGAEDGVTAYSGAAYDPTRRYFLFNGGGHLDGSGNGVYAARVGLDAPDVVALRADSSDPEYNVAYYSDGTPSARHTYRSLVYLPAFDGMFQFGCTSPYGDGNYRDGTVNRFDLATNAWDPAGTYATMPAETEDYSMSACFDEAGNVYVNSNRSHSLLQWTPGSPGSWSELWSDGGIDAGSSALVFDPMRDRIVHFGGESSAAWWSLAGARTAITWGGTAAGAAPGASLVYCPERDSFIGASSNGEDTVPSIIEVDPETFAVTEIAMTGMGPIPDGGGFGAESGFYNRLQIDPSLGVIFFHAGHGSRNVWAFRYE